MTMAKTKPKHQKQSAAAKVEIVQAPWGPVLTQIAFVLTVALVAARALISEVLRDTVLVSPGSTIGPRGTGAATSLVLDAICWLPALLVLIRVIIEKDYPIRLRASHILLALFALLAIFSTLWSADQFAALVTASHLVTAAIVIWSTTQLVRSWLRLRIIAGICFGLLLAYLAHGLIYRFVDSADNVSYWHQYHDEVLKQRNWEPDSFEAKQFEKKLMSREIIGFNQSPNSFAAVIVMLAVISAGAAIQRRADRAGMLPSVLIVLSFPFAFLLLYFTGSRTSFGTILIAATVLLTIWKTRPWLAANPRVAYTTGAGIAIVIVLAVIGHGLYHGSLPGASLTFRWRYWIAASRIFQAHPILGIGWSNFGNHYTSVRLPIAAEEIRDPHNFIVRAFSELGSFGGVLLLAWLARLAWEISRPITPPTTTKSSPQSRKAFGAITAIIMGAILINLIASIDWSQQGWFLLLEAFRRLIFLGLMLAGTLIVTVRSIKDQEADDRPATWILYAMLTALAVFFVHNLLDFSLAEPGPLMLFALLVGACLGARTTWINVARHRTGAIAAISIGTIVWITFTLGVVLPVDDAENQQQAGDAAMQAGNPHSAATLYLSAYHRMPLNADYAFRSAQAMRVARETPERVKATLDTAIGRNPRDAGYHLTRAAIESEQGDLESAKADFEKSIPLDPNNIGIRLDYAKILEALNDRPGAAEQYKIALEKNSQLHPDEPKRLSPRQVDQIKMMIGESSP